MNAALLQHPAALPEYVRAGPYRFPLEARRNARARRMTLRYHPLRDVALITLPRRCDPAQAARFLASRQSWFDRHLGDLPPRTLLTFGATIPVLGAPRVLVSAIGKESQEKNALPLLATAARCETVARAALAALLRAHLEEKVAEWTGRPFFLTLHDAVTRWGSCSHDGRLAFSWRLVFAPREVADYVAAHETAHLDEMHHGPAFWKLVERLCPDYRERRSWLKRYGRLLYRYGAAVT